jgi:hypothetical protein
MSSLAFVIELLKLSISQISLSRTPVRIHRTENSMLAYILQDLEMPSIGKNKNTTPGHPVVAMVHLAVAAASRMVPVAVVQAVGFGEAATEVKAEVVRSQKRTNTGAEQSERWP